MGTGIVSCTVNLRYCTWSTNK